LVDLSASESLYFSARGETQFFPPKIANPFDQHCSQERFSDHRTINSSEESRCHNSGFVDRILGGGWT
jgi:hypothetical protein